MSLVWWVQAGLWGSLQAADSLGAGDLGLEARRLPVGSWAGVPRWVVRLQATRRHGPNGTAGGRGPDQWSTSASCRGSGGTRNISQCGSSGAALRPVLVQGANHNYGVD